MKIEQIGSVDHLFPLTCGIYSEVWKTQGGRMFYIPLWNGECWLECWEFFPDGSAGPAFSTDQIRRWKEEEIPDEVPWYIEENSDEWDSVHEIIGINI